MKRFLEAVLLSMCLISFGAEAQEYKNTPVTVSTEKVESGGKTYYSHIVLERQTLFSISKAYGVSYQEIIDANKSVNLAGGGLKAGQVLLIPDKGELPAPETHKDVPAQQAAQGDQAAAAQATKEESSDDYILYTVKWYEDLGMIASRYDGMTKEILMAYNGMTSARLSMRQVIKIPRHPELVDISKTVTESADKAETDAEDKGKDKAEAKASVEDRVKEAGAKVKEAGAKVKDAGAALISAISGKKKSAEDEKTEEETVSAKAEETETKTVQSVTETPSETITDTTDIAEVTAVRDSLDLIDSLANEAGNKLRSFFNKEKKDRISLAVILPLNAKGKVNDSAYDLYSGILMAVNDLGKVGIKTDVAVYDSKDVQTQFTEDTLGGYDLIIGPIDPSEIQGVLDICPKDVLIVSPLDPKAINLIDGNPNLIQAPSSNEAQYNELVNWISEEKRAEDKLLLITQKGKPATGLAEAVTASGMSFSTLEYGILEGRAAIAKLEGTMTNEAVNRVVIASEDEAFVNDAVRNLNLMTYKNFNVVLYAPSKIRTFETIDVESLHNLNTRSACSYFVDYDSARTKDFLMSYRALFEAEPTPFAYQGYDAAYYFIRNIATDERDSERIARMESRKYRGIQSDYLMKVGEGDDTGYANCGIRRVIYRDDYSVTLAD